MVRIPGPTLTFNATKINALFTQRDPPDSLRWIWSPNHQNPPTAQVPFWVFHVVSDTHFQSSLSTIITRTQPIKSWTSCAPSRRIQERASCCRITNRWPVVFRQYPTEEVGCNVDDELSLWTKDEERGRERGWEVCGWEYNVSAVAKQRDICSIDNGWVGFGLVDIAISSKWCACWTRKNHWVEAWWRRELVLHFETKCLLR